MKLLNIRLNPEDVARVRALRARGVQMSYLLREAIRAEHQRRIRIPLGGSVEEVLAKIYAEHPVNKEEERQHLDVHDRHGFRKAVRRHVRRRMDR